MDTKFHTMLDFEECEKIAFDKSKFGCRTSFIFKYNNGHFSVRKVEFFNSNAFSRNFYGELLMCSKGTDIKGSFKMSPITKVIIAIAYGILFSVDLFVIYKGMFCNGSPTSITKSDLITALMMLFGGKLIILAIIKKNLDKGLENQYHVINYIKSLFKAE